MLRGVSIDDAGGIYKIKKHLISGIAEVSSTSILIGKELADELRLSVGSSVRISTPSGGGDPFGS